MGRETGWRAYEFA